MKPLAETDGITEWVLGMVAAAPALSRRSVLKLCGATIAGMASLTCFGIGSGESAPLVITEQANGLVIADPSRCVACRRCELACTDYNDGRSSSALSRIKVWRNLNFGPSGLYDAGQRGSGDWGTGLVVQDFCKQCPHPVPCADACPNAAIEVKPPTNARVVNPAKCTGCKVCLKACPWEMISFDADQNKATKCFLCDGKPKCVEACPSGALMYVSWVDLTGKTPIRNPLMAGGVQACADCHK